MQEAIRLKEVRLRIAVPKCYSGKIQSILSDLDQYNYFEN